MAHRLFREEWSEEQNFKVFGKCANPNFHGHNYELWVTVKGEAPQTPYILDLKLLKLSVNNFVIELLGHKYQPGCRFHAG